MFIPPLIDNNLLPRQARVEIRQAQEQRSPEVPLWAFIVMTVFSLVLMAFVGFLLWRPDIFRSIQQPALDGSTLEGKSGDALQQEAPCSRAGSLRRPWFRSGGSFRSNINRWRNGVDREEGPSPSINASPDGYLDEPAAYNYAPAPARPVSCMQRIPEGYEQYEQSDPYVDAKSARTAQQRL